MTTTNNINTMQLELLARFASILDGIMQIFKPVAKITSKQANVRITI